MCKIKYERVYKPLMNFALSFSQIIFVFKINVYGKREGIRNTINAYLLNLFVENLSQRVSF